jgi:hypothetical protein
MERFIVIKTGELCEGREAAALALAKTWLFTNNGRIDPSDTYERTLLRNFVEGRDEYKPGRLPGDLEGLVKVAS